MRSETKDEVLGQGGGDSALVPSKALGSAGPVLRLAPSTTAAGCAGRGGSCWDASPRGLGSVWMRWLTGRDRYAGPNHTQTDAVAGITRVQPRSLTCSIPQWK